MAEAAVKAPPLKAYPVIPILAPGALAASKPDAASLRHGAAFLRRVDHAVRLVTGKAAEGLPAHVGHREAIESLARHWGLVPPSATLAEKLKEAQREVRYVYRRVIGSD